MASIRKCTSVCGSRSSTFVLARSLAAALTMSAGVALSAVTAAVSSATAQELEWAKKAGGNGADASHDIATENSGNSYVTRIFFGSATFGAGEANETELSGGGGFLANYDRNGRLVWATKTAGGAALATNSRGDSYIVGSFVAKYDRNGQLVWDTEAGGTGAAIATDGRGESYVTGRFNGAVTFGLGEANETELSSAGGNDIFVAKYDRNGQLAWATKAGGVPQTSGTGADSSTGIATDGSGNSYVTGSFDSMALFGESEANETKLGADFIDVFVARCRNGPKPKPVRRGGCPSG